LSTLTTLVSTLGDLMSSYIIVELNVLDADKLAQYSQLAAPTIAKAGGKFIAKSPVQSLHGDAAFSNKVVIEFPSEQEAKDWYQGEEYQVLIALRNEAMESQFQLVVGV